METLAQRVTYGVRAVLPIVGATATVVLVRRGTRPAVLVGAWVGSGYLFAAGLFGGPATTVGHLVDIVGVGSGLTLAMALFLALPTAAGARDRT